MTIVTKKSLYLNASGSNVISSDIHASGTLIVGGEMTGSAAKFNVGLGDFFVDSTNASAKVVGGEILLGGMLPVTGAFIVDADGTLFSGGTFVVATTDIVFTGFNNLSIDGPGNIFIAADSGITGSTFVPRNNSVTLGSSTKHWDTIYVDNIVGATVEANVDFTQVGEIGVTSSLVVSSSAVLSVLGEFSASYAEVSNDLSVNGNIQVTQLTAESINITNDLTVGGNLTVNGTQTILNVTELVIEDKLITLASGNKSDNDAIGAGIEVEVAGGTNKWIKFNNSQGNAWTTNIDWSPSSDNTKNLGNGSLQWHDLFLAGAIYGTGGARLSGDTTLANGIAVTGTGSFSGNVTSNNYLISPIAVVTTSLGTGLNTAMFTASNLGIAGGEILKAKLEVLALSEDKADACSWELSIVGSRNGSTVAGGVIEIIKLPITGSTAPNFDLVVEVVSNGLKVSVNDASQGGNVHWYGQITKKMILNTVGSAVA